jgi:hypothetical protein
LRESNICSQVSPTDNQVPRLGGRRVRRPRALRLVHRHAHVTHVRIESNAYTLKTKIKCSNRSKDYSNAVSIPSEIPKLKKLKQYVQHQVFFCYKVVRLFTCAVFFGKVYLQLFHVCDSRARFELTFKSNNLSIVLPLFKYLQ